MPGLPSRPSKLILHPHGLALEQALAPAAGEVRAGDGHATFNTLFAQLGILAGKRYALPWVGFFLVRRVLADAGGSWQALARDPFAVYAVQRALAEIRLAGVAAGHVVRKRPSPELAALAGVLGRYERALDAAGLFDDADREREAVLAVSSRRASVALSGLQRVRVEGGGSLFGARADLLAALGGTGVTVEVRLPYDPERRTVFSWPEASLHRLEAHSTSAVAIELDARIGAGPLAALRRAQFTQAAAPEAPVRLVEVARRNDHARTAASVVAGWLRAGIPPQSIAVVCPDIDGQGVAVRHELTSLGVRVSMRRGVPLAASGVAGAWGTAVQLADRGFPREPFTDLWLRLNRPVATPAGRMDAARVSRLLRASGVRSARVGGYRQRLLAYARTAHEPRGVVTAVADAVEELMIELGRVPEEAGALEQIDALDRLARTLLPALRPHEARGSWPNPRDRFLLGVAFEEQAVEVLDEMLSVLRQAVAAVPAQPLSRRELAMLLQLAVRSRRLEVGGRGEAAVEVLRPDDLVETRYSRVVLVGVDADVFPAAVARHPILTEDLRIELNDLLGPRLLQLSPMTGREGLRADARDLWLWVEALAAVQEELVVTYTRPEGKGEAGLSELVRELVRSLGGRQGELWRGAHQGGEVQSLAQARQRWAWLRCGGEGTWAGERAALEVALEHRDPRSLVTVERRLAAARTLSTPPYRLTVLDDRERAVITARLLGSALSTSSLDTLGTCSFRYFAQTLLRLAAEQEGTLGPAARDEGSLAHAVLEAVYADLLRRGGLGAARREPAAAREHARRAFEAAREHIAGQVALHPLLEGPALEAAWYAALRQLEHDLADDDEREPLCFEYRFDDREGCAPPPLRLEAPDGERTVRVCGSIDRIDRVGDCLEAIDYKRRPQKRPEGRHFQLSIYAALALRDFGDGVTRLRAVWRGLRDAEPVEAVAEAPSAEFLAQLRTGLWTRLDRVLAGDVSPDPEPATACHRCDFSALCRYRAPLDGDEP